MSQKCASTFFPIEDNSTTKLKFLVSYIGPRRSESALRSSATTSNEVSAAQKCLHFCVVERFAMGYVVVPSQTEISEIKVVRVP